MKHNNTFAERHRRKDLELKIYGIEGDEFNGIFEFKSPTFGTLKVIISDGFGWEHVSVSKKDKTPSWDEMCFIKDIFFNDDEVVMQLHPAKKDYVNNHKHCLHLWKPLNDKSPCPLNYMVGDKDIKVVRK